MYIPPLSQQICIHISPKKNTQQTNIQVSRRRVQCRISFRPPSSLVPATFAPLASQLNPAHPNPSNYCTCSPRLPLHPVSATSSAVPSVFPSSLGSCQSAENTPGWLCSGVLNVVASGEGSDSCGIALGGESRESLGRYLFYWTRMSLHAGKHQYLIPLYYSYTPKNHFKGYHNSTRQKKSDESDR